MDYCVWDFGRFAAIFLPLAVFVDQCCCRFLLSCAAAAAAGMQLWARILVILYTAILAARMPSFGLRGPFFAALDPHG